MTGLCTGGSMDRASDSGSEGWGFESLPVYQINKGIPTRGIPLFILHFVQGGTRKIKSQYAGGILLQPVQKLVATLIFARLTQGQKCKRVPSGVRAVSLRFQTVVLNLLLGADPTVCSHFTVYDNLWQFCCRPHSNFHKKDLLFR